MSEVKKIATRESYGNALVEIGKEHEDLVVLDADLAGATKTAIFQKVFPERHIDCGIAEGNMMGVAAGFGIYKRFRRYHNNNPRNLVSYTLTQVFFHFVPESRLFETDVLPISSKKA